MLLEVLFSLLSLSLSDQVEGTLMYDKCHEQQCSYLIYI